MDAERAAGMRPGILVAILLLALTAQPADGIVAQEGTSPVSQQSGEPLQLVGHVGGAANAVAVRGSFAYLVAGPRFVVFDVSEPRQPAAIAEVILEDTGEDLALQGDYGYVATGWGLQVIVDLRSTSAATDRYSSPSRSCYLQGPGGDQGIVRISPAR